MAFRVPEVTDGRQGGVMQYTGSRRALISVLHDERVTLTPTSGPSDVAFAANSAFVTPGWSVRLFKIR